MKNMTQCKVAKVFIDDRDICWIEYNKTQNLIIDMPEAKELAETILKVCDGQPRYMINDGRDAKSNMNKEVREYFQDHVEFNKIRLGSAIIVNSFMSRLLANLFMSYTQPRVPTKVFEKEEDAINWIADLAKN